jgi:hypothetical protein
MSDSIAAARDAAKDATGKAAEGIEGAKAEVSTAKVGVDTAAVDIDVARLEADVARLRVDRAEARLQHARAVAAVAAGAPDIDPAAFIAALEASEAALVLKETELGVAKAKR